MPTFDFSNLIRETIRLTVRTLTNPITFTIGFATTVLTVASKYNWLSNLTFTLPEALNISLANVDSNFLQLILYCTDYKTLYLIVDFVLTTLPKFLAGFLLFIVSLFVGHWTGKAFNAVRKSIKDMAG